MSLGGFKISNLEDLDYQNLASWIRSSQENGIESVLTFLHERKLSVKLRSFISKTVTEVRMPLEPILLYITCNFAH